MPTPQRMPGMALPKAHPPLSSEPAGQTGSYSKKGRGGKRQGGGSCGSSPVASSLAERGSFALPVAARDEDNGLSPGHSGKGNAKVCLSYTRFWFMGQVLLAALVLVALCSLIFFALFAPYLARVHEPLVLLEKGGQRIVVRVHEKAWKNADPITDLSHPRLAGRREMLHLLEEPISDSRRRRR